MGWFRDDHPNHEGFTVGYVVREGTGEGSDILRELAYPTDNADLGKKQLPRIGAGCTCGWRSPYLVPREPAEWSPFVVHLGKWDEERVRGLWDEHLEPNRVRQLLDEAADLAHSLGDDGFIPSHVAAAIRDLAKR